MRLRHVGIVPLFLSPRWFSLHTIVHFSTSTRPRAHQETIVKIVRPMWLLMVAALLACSSQEADWKKADAQGTVTGYQKFLTDHPTSAHAEQARGRMQALQDEHAWTEAKNTSTAYSYKQYLDTQPNGIHAADAHDRITGLERAAAWKVAQADGKATALQEFLQKYPQGAEADEARAQLQKLNAASYRVQLGAFRSKKEAQRLRARLQAKYGNALHDVVVVAPTGRDKLNRVRSGTMSQEEARSACAKLKKAHQHCEVVKG